MPNNQPSDERAYAAARKSFKAFCFLVHEGFECPPHVELLIAECELVLRGKTKRLADILPPRHGKSLLVAILFVAYFLGRNPRANVILGTYGSELSETWGRRIRNILQSEMFQKIFPDCVLSPDSQAAARFNTTRGGQFIGVGRGGPMTGFGADLMVLDDLIKDAAEASSDVVCRGIVEWLQHVVFTRLSRRAAVVAISTRWSDRDAMGWMLREQRGWRVVHLPAVSEGARDLLGRPQGEALWPSHFPLPSLEEIRLNVGPQAWMSLYQGRPSAAQGLVFKRQWFRRYATPPERFSRIIQSWDTAFKVNAGNDYSVCTTWGQTENGYYLLHLWRDKVEFPELKRQVAALADQWKPHNVVVEDKASGQSLVQELKVSTLFPVTPVKVDADKTTRASAITGYFEAGKIFFPEGAAWLADLEDELAGFPGVVHDDQVDSVSQAINFLRDTSGALGWVEYLKNLARGIFSDDSLPAPAGQQVDERKAAALRAQIASQEITSNPFSAARQNAAGQKLSGPPCVACGGATEKLFTQNYRCTSCQHVFQTDAPESQERINRRDLFAGRVHGGGQWSITGPGAPDGGGGGGGRGRFGRFG